MVNPAGGLVFLVENELDGKIVQIEVGKNKIPYMALGNIYERHGAILDTLLQTLDIPFQKALTDDTSTHACAKGESYVAVGMGVFIKIGNKHLALIGDSQGYSLKPCAEHAQRLENLSGYRIELM